MSYEEMSRSAREIFSPFAHGRSEAVGSGYQPYVCPQSFRANLSLPMPISPDSCTDTWRRATFRAWPIARRMGWLSDGQRCPTRAYRRYMSPTRSGHTVIARLTSAQDAMAAAAT
jgi:hypothetical protein